MSAHHTTHTPKFYKLADGASEGLLFASIVFAPWAFGTTQPWSIAILNGAGYGMGMLLVCKWLIRWKTGYEPARWNQKRENSPISAREPAIQCYLAPTLALLSLFLLGYCLVSILNARATYHHHLLGFAYYENVISWLPHSYDRRGTWMGFQNYLALFCFFWASHDWLLGKTRKERHYAGQKSCSSPQEPLHAPTDQANPFPSRFRRLLWLLCLNGAILGLVSILQRLEGTTQILWLTEPKASGVVNHFGSFAYRSNAAQYFNLLWPISFGFWWSMHQAHSMRLRLNPRLGSGSHLLLLPVSILIAVCPILSLSRGGALLFFAGLPLVMLMIYLTSHRSRPVVSVPTIFLCLLGMGLYLGWAPLQKRLANLRDIASDASSIERLDQYARTWEMVRDYPVFGIGPNAYEATYPLYRTPGQKWYPFAHNDWLQFLAEWGILGFSLILLGLGMCLVFPWLGKSPAMPLAGTFLVSFMLALAHSAFDFPFQVPSLLFTFVILLSLYVCLPSGSFVSPRQRHLKRV